MGFIYSWGESFNGKLGQGPIDGILTYIEHYPRRVLKSQKIITLKRLNL